MSSSGNPGLTSVPMLNGGNYLEWSAAMKAYLRFIQVWGYVKGTIAMPSDNKSPEYLKWDQEDEHAIGAMLLRIPFNYHHLSKDGKKDCTSKQLWDAVEAQFAKQGTAGLYADFLAAIHFSVKEGEDPIPVLSNLTTILQRLPEDQVKLSMKVQVLLYIAALPKSWDGFKTSILTTLPDNVSDCDLSSGVIQVSRIITRIKERMKRT